jgi:hypothetical protein
LPASPISLIVGLGVAGCVGRRVDLPGPPAGCSFAWARCVAPVVTLGRFGGARARVTYLGGGAECRDVPVGRSSSAPGLPSPGDLVVTAGAAPRIAAGAAATATTTATTAVRRVKGWPAGLLEARGIAGARFRHSWGGSPDLELRPTGVRAGSTGHGRRRRRPICEPLGGAALRRRPSRWSMGGRAPLGHVRPTV